MSSQFVFGSGSVVVPRTGVVRDPNSRSRQLMTRLLDRPAPNRRRRDSRSIGRDRGHHRAVADPDPDCRVRVAGELGEERLRDPDGRLDLARPGACHRQRPRRDGDADNPLHTSNGPQRATVQDDRFAGLAVSLILPQCPAANEPKAWLSGRGLSRGPPLRVSDNHRAVPPCPHQLDRRARLEARAAIAVLGRDAFARRGSGVRITVRQGRLGLDWISDPTPSACSSAMERR